MKLLGALLIFGEQLRFIWCLLKLQRFLAFWEYTLHICDNMGMVTRQNKSGVKTLKHATFMHVQECAEKARKVDY